MATIYLHVGPHKTGSTYLQYCFYKQASSLKTQGVEYPIIGREHSITGHHNLAWLFTRRNLINTSIEKLSKGISELSKQKDQSFLFSSEEFSNLKDDALESLRDTFPNHSFHTLFFVRRGGKLIISLWREIIKGGSTVPLNKMSQDFWIQEGGYNPFEPEKNIARYKKHLGGTISMFDYEQLIKNGVDLVNPVSEVMKVKLKGSKKKLNQSTTIEVTELIRAANLYTQSLGKFLIGYPRTICARMLQVPLLNLFLKNNVHYHFRKLYQTLSIKEFIELGYKESDLGNFDLSYLSKYVPEKEMLNALNKDNILPWKIIKKLIENK